ncbi:hypothetical protein ACJROX_27030 [Pseudalkalibacillus sp. A8]|uniref:hypothetical protein n=1 Tax=Pseudalkalibacillus sp. A8 TaxID=3382641 RepID=UPI0038B622F3
MQHLKKEELDQCDKCMRRGRAKNLKKLPKDIDNNQQMKYCPRCYPEMEKEIRKLWWNQGKKNII